MPRLKQIFFSSASIIFFFLFLEGGGQLLYHVKYGRWYSGSWNGPAMFLENTPSLTIPHPRLPYVLNPGYTNEGTGIFINSLGFRNDEFAADQKDDSRVFLLGDSCVFGWNGSTYTDQKKIFPFLLQEKLKERLKKNIRVVNGGVPGYASHEVLLFFREFKDKLRPDWLGIYVGWNDMVRAVEEGTDTNKTINTIQPSSKGRLWREINGWFTAKSVFYSKLRNVLTGYGSDKTRIQWDYTHARIPSDDEIIYKNFYRNLKDIVGAARANNIKVFLVTLATGYDDNFNEKEFLKRKQAFSPGYEYMQPYFHVMSQKLAEIEMVIGKEESIPVFRLDQEFWGKDKARLFVGGADHDHIHFSPAGHEAVADFLAAKLTPVLGFP